ncbi:trichohyalin [Artemisia annua]|uniref:Trichohyalin n=1 Tax=Artemisia annua TaxID=35608 RepID=A0A2U1L230_ARTAN|nr:trichohyalin [Artemisia annua]
MDIWICNIEVACELQKKDEQQQKKDEQESMFTVVEIAITHMKRSFRSGVRSSDIEIITPTLHRSIIYKEQAQLNQAVSNSLMPRFEAQKAMCFALQDNFQETRMNTSDYEFASGDPHRARHQLEILEAEQAKPLKDSSELMDYLGSMYAGAAQ